MLEQSVPVPGALNAPGYMAFASRMDTSTDVRRDNGCEAPIHKLHNEERFFAERRFALGIFHTFEGLGSDFTLQ